jgi:RNA polymerase sigma-70 factor (ECF subfamily)
MGSALMDSPTVAMTESAVHSDDAKLLRAFIERGSKDAMSELFTRHADAAFRLALRCSSNAADAEDAVQAAFLTVMRCAGQYRAESSVRVWIMGVVVHACKDKVKAERTRKSYENKASAMTSAERSHDPAEKELQDAALSAVNELPKTYRLPVWLHFLEGLSFADVSRVLGQPENTVRSQANRGIEQLRQTLAGAGFSASVVSIQSALSSSVLPAASPALKASLSAIALGGAGKAGGAGVALTNLAKLFTAKLAIASAVVVTSVATAAATIHFSNQPNQTPAAAPVAVSLPHTSNEPKGGDEKTPAAKPAWPAGKVVGWRGDGTGHYPDANPPTTWMRNEKGEKKNIKWEVKMPSYSFSTPIIVGDKIFTRSESYDLICLDKMTGKLLWIRSYPTAMAVSADERKAHPEFAQIDPFLADLQKVNDEFVAQGWKAELYQKKIDLHHKINDMTEKIDKRYKLPNDQYVESWAGVTGQQAWSDGQYIYLTSGHGVSACYDLEGNKKWAVFEPLATSEHGHGWSPALFDDKFIVPRYSTEGKFEIMALNKATGETLWRLPFDKGPQTWSIAQFKLNGVEYGVTFGRLFRISDGKSVDVVGHCAQTVKQGDDMLYSIDNTGQVTWFKVQPDLKISLLTPGNKQGNAELMIEPEDQNQKWNPMANFHTAAPLYHDGLVYVVSNWGRLAVCDPVKAEIVYTRKLPFDFKNPQSRKSFGMGIGASPALAGKYIYMIDSAGCTIVMEPGREYKQVAKNNIDEIVPHAWEPKHWMAEHHEQTEATPIFDGERIYIRGEQYMYCIAEDKAGDKK